MIAIPKRDNRIWAIAGGVPDGTDKISSALKRELIAETRSRSINMSMAERITYAFMIGSVFIDDLTEIYSGYVDDPRNTDNSWVETTVCNYHDDSANTFETLTLQAGSDAKRFQWLDIDGNLNFYSNHKLFVKRAVDLLKAHWWSVAISQLKTCVFTSTMHFLVIYLYQGVNTCRIWSKINLY